MPEKLVWTRHAARSIYFPKTKNVVWTAEKRRNTSHIFRTQPIKKKKKVIIYFQKSYELLTSGPSPPCPIPLSSQKIKKKVKERKEKPSQ